MEFERIHRLARACLTCDCYDRLGAITCPTLVLGVTASRVNDTLTAVVENWIGLAERGDFGAIVTDMTRDSVTRRMRKQRISTIGSIVF